MKRTATVIAILSYIFRPEDTSSIAEEFGRNTDDILLEMRYPKIHHLKAIFWLLAAVFLSLGGILLDVD